jgi:recombination protein RecA
MAKKKIKEDEEQSESLPKVDLSSIVIDASFIKDNPKEILSISPAFDQGLCGGIPKGSFVIVSGLQKCGKTYSIMHMISKHLNQFPNSKCLYLDVEHRVKPFHLSLPNLPLDRIQIVRSQKGNIVAGEDYLTCAEQFIRDNTDCIVVVDSSSALLPRKEQEEGISGELRAIAPKLLAHFCRRVGQILSVQDAILIMITHLSKDMNAKNPKYAGWKEDGGNKIQYHSDIKIKCVSSIPKLNSREEEIGKDLTWTVAWASLGAGGKTINSYIRYGIGIDEIMESIEPSVNFGLIAKAGSWYTCDFMTELGEEPKKLQGEDKLCAFLSSDKKYWDCLREQLKMML